MGKNSISPFSDNADGNKLPSKIKKMPIRLSQILVKNIRKRFRTPSRTSLLSKAVANPKLFSNLMSHRLSILFDSTNAQSLLTKQEMKFGYNFSESSYKVTKKTKKCRFSEYLSSTSNIILPQSTFKISWNIFIVLLVFFNAIELPFLFGFQTENISLEFKIVQYTIDFIFVIDIFINFFTTFQDPDTYFYVFDHQQIATRYLKFWFWIDLLSVFPFELIVGGSVSRGVFGIVKCIRLMRMSKVWKFLKSISVGKYSANLRMFWMLVLYVLIIHWFACVFGAIALYYTDDGTWLEFYNLHNTDSFHRYTFALYWSAMSVSTCGYGDIVPQNNVEKILVSCILITSSLWYAIIFGNVLVFLNGRNIDQFKYDIAMSRIYSQLMFNAKSKNSMTAKDKKIRNTIIEYYEYLWSKHRKTANEDIMKNIPFRVRHEVSISTHSRMMKNNIVFQFAHITFIHAMANKFQFSICLPNEYVYKEGEAAHSVFFVSRGQVGVFGGGINSLLTVLKQSSYFGECPFYFRPVCRNEPESSHVCNKSIKFLGNKALIDVDYDDDRDEDENIDYERDPNSIFTDEQNEKTFHDQKYYYHSVRGYSYTDLWTIKYTDFANILSQMMTSVKKEGNRSATIDHMQTYNNMRKINDLLCSIARMRMNKRKIGHYYSDIQAVKKIAMKFYIANDDELRHRNRMRRSNILADAIVDKFETNNENIGDKKERKSESQKQKQKQNQKTSSNTHHRVEFLHSFERKVLNLMKRVDILHKKHSLE